MKGTLKEEESLEVKERDVLVARGQLLLLHLSRWYPWTVAWSWPGGLVCLVTGTGSFPRHDDRDSRESASISTSRIPGTTPRV